MPMALIRPVTHCVGHRFPVFFRICVCHNVQKGEAAVLRVALLKFGGSSKSSGDLTTVKSLTLSLQCQILF